MPVRIITGQAWHSLFARTMFIKPETLDVSRKHVPDFTVIAAPGFNASPLVDMTRTGTFIILHPAGRLTVNGGTCYRGEVKKTNFTVLNALLPFEGVLPTHCSANMGGAGVFNFEDGYRGSTPARGASGRFPKTSYTRALLDAALNGRKTSSCSRPSRSFPGPVRCSLPPAEPARLLAKADAAAAIVQKADLLSKLGIEGLKAQLD